MMKLVLTDRKPPDAIEAMAVKAVARSSNSQSI